MANLRSTRIGFIGAGRMATALARGFVQADLLLPRDIAASDPIEAARLAFARELPGANVVDQNCDVAAKSDVLFLAVKPQTMDGVLAEIRHTIAGNALIVSIAAGVTLQRLTAGLPAGQRIVRVMPNTPCLVGQGASAYSAGEFATSSDRALVSQLLASVGVAYEVAEEQLNAVTGLSGSGPAFVYTMIEALVEGGTMAGLSGELALALAAHTVAGAAQMVLATGQSPADLRNCVTSPGGTTLAGLAVLEEGGFKQLVASAVAAATRRSVELGRGAP